MASDYLLEIEGIKGESQDSKHKETIEIDSFSWGASNPGSFAGGTGGGAGKVTFSDINFTTTVNKSSPELMIACATGKHIKKATLFVRKSGGDPQDFYILKFADLLVSSYSSGGGGNSPPHDSFALNFAAIEYNYHPQKDDGSLESPVVAKYDLKQSKR